MRRAMPDACPTHMPDAMHERTNELTNAETPPTTPRDQVSVGNARTRIPAGFVYLVHWPAAEFTKVGCSVDGRRWRPFLRRGGVLLDVIQPEHDDAPLVEWRMHVDLGTCRMPHRFTTSAEAVPYLGGSGRGFTECYVDRTGRAVIDRLNEIGLASPNRWADR